MMPSREAAAVKSPPGFLSSFIISGSDLCQRFFVFDSRIFWSPLRKRCEGKDLLVNVVVFHRLVTIMFPLMAGFIFPHIEHDDSTLVI